MAIGNILGLIGTAAASYAKAVSNKNKSKSSSSKSSSGSTSAYKNPTYANKTYGDEEPIYDKGGNAVGSYSKQRADSKNGTAWIPGVGDVPITIVNGRVQETNLPIGTIVNTAGGKYKIDGATANGYTSTPYTGSYGSSNVGGGGSVKTQGMQQPITQAAGAALPVNPYAAQLEQNQTQYDALLKDYRNLIDAQVNRGEANLESQKGMINQNADEMARQAYVLSRQNAKVLPQQLASRGMTGGATETAQLGLQTNYENNLNNINTNRYNAINSVDTAVTDLKNQGELSYAEQTLNNNQAALNAYRNMLDKSVGYDQWQANFGADRADTEWNQNYQTGRDSINDERYNNEFANSNKQQEYNNILTRLGMGLISPNDAVALGVSPQDVQAFVGRINQAADLDIANSQSLLTKRNTPSGSSSGSSSGGTDLTGGVIETALKHLQKGDREKAIGALASIMSNAEIKSYLEQNGVRTDDIDWGIEEAAPAQSSSIFDPNSPYQRFVGTPKSLEMLVSYYKGKGYTDQKIANILNK